MTPPSWSVCIFMVGEDGECRKPFPTLTFPIATVSAGGSTLRSPESDPRGAGLGIPGASEGAHLLGGVLQGRALPSLFPALCESPGAPCSDPLHSSGSTGGRWAGWQSLSEELSEPHLQPARGRQLGLTLRGSAHTGSSHSAGQTSGRLSNAGAQ